MTGNQMMDYYVRPRHLYSDSRPCTHSGLCRIPSKLVAFHICYLLDHAKCSWDFSSRDLIPVYVRYLQPLWRSWSIVHIHLSWRSWSFVYLHHGDSGLFIFYMGMTTHVIFCIMPIHGHCTVMYPGLLHLLAVMCRVWSLYCTDWMAGSSTGLFITPLLGWTYNVFWPSYDPFDLTY